MEKITLGVIEIYPPDETMSYFFISQDFIELLNVETNYDAARLIQKTLREKLERKLHNRIYFDSEGDAVIISISKADLMFQVANILNDMASIPLSCKVKEEAEHQLLTYKRPKKQRWKQGDVFMVPLDDQTFTLAQVLEKGTHTALCALLDNVYIAIPDLEKELSGKRLKAVVPILSTNLDNHVYKVIDNKKPLICVPDTEEYDEIRYGSFYSSILVDIADHRAGWDPVTDVVEEILELQQNIRTLL